MRLQPDALWFRFRFSVGGAVDGDHAGLPSSFVQPKQVLLGTSRVDGLATLLHTSANDRVVPAESVSICIRICRRISDVAPDIDASKSLIFGCVALASQWPSFLQSGISRPTVVSGAVATLMFISITRSKYLSDIRFFLASQQNIDSQRRMIEMNVDFTDRIRAFLPREISTRLTERLSDNRHTVLQAVDEILTPSQRPVACLFSDIRGFTQATKSSNAFLGEGVIPNIRRCNAVIERYHGIPRKIGDLDFRLL